MNCDNLATTGVEVINIIERIEVFFNLSYIDRQHMHDTCQPVKTSFRGYGCQVLTLETSSSNHFNFFNTGSIFNLKYYY